MKPALEIRQLCKTYADNQVVNNLDFSIPQGEIFGLLGPNGAGKSTTINMISGVARIGSGQINIFEHSINAKTAIAPGARRVTGVMHQEIVADPFFTINQALVLQPGFFGIKHDRNWHDYLIERLQLGPHIHKNMNQLSGGLKRRFMLAKALIHRPKLLILDEPTAGVDVELRHSLWQFIRDINAKGTSILLTTHYLEEAQQMCNRIGILKEGRLVALDQTEKLVNCDQERWFDLHLRKPLQQIPHILEQFNPHINKSRKILTLKPDCSTDISTIMSALTDTGIVVHNITSATPSLEDIFLRLTGTLQTPPSRH